MTIEHVSESTLLIVSNQNPIQPNKKGFWLPISWKVSSLLQAPTEPAISTLPVHFLQGGSLTQWHKRPKAAFKSYPTMLAIPGEKYKTSLFQNFQQGSQVSWSHAYPWTNQHIWADAGLSSTTPGPCTHPQSVRKGWNPPQTYRLKWGRAGAPKENGGAVMKRGKGSQNQQISIAEDLSCYLRKKYCESQSRLSQKAWQAQYQLMIVTGKN